jgi:biotin synthase
MSDSQAQQLKAAGLDYYNHNIDTSPNYYPKVITTRTFQDRLDTLQKVRDAGIAVCCGGILGLGETITDRFEFLQVLSNLDPQPESVPVNQLMPVAGTPLADAPPVQSFDLVRLIATARILMPKTVIRLTAGRLSMSDELQAMCFFAGANSIFIGDTLLTEGNPECARDEQLLANLGMNLSAATV